jgi:hypothetical protein
MKYLAMAAALAVGIASVGSVHAKGDLKTTNGAPPALTNIQSTPLIIHVGADHSFQVFNTDIGSGSVGQIYPSSSTSLADMGWFVRVNGVLTAPSFGDHGNGTATGSLGTTSKYTGQTVSAVSGAGSPASPFSVTVTGTTASGLLTTQTVTYVIGDNYFRKAFKVDNPSGSPVVADIFLASDIYLASSDAGIPFQESFSGSPGGQTCAGITPPFTILHISLGIPSTGYTASAYASVWSQIGSGALNNTIAPPTCIDNGAGLQWGVTIPANGTVTVQAATSFGDIPGSLFGVGDPVFNYSVLPQPGVNQQAINCIRAKFPSNPPTNSFGWAPSEGEWYHEDYPGSPMQPPNGLAAAILQCFVFAWDAGSGALYHDYCWENPSPNYIGNYPDQRQANFRIYHAINGVCGDFPPLGTTVYEAQVTLSRRLYYPPLPPPPPPLLVDGFE